MNATVASRRLWAVVAACLLLLQSMLPVLHDLQHALADGHGHASAVCCHCHGHGTPAPSAAADEHADACGLCVQLMQVRDLLPEPPALPVIAVAPPRALACDVAEYWFAPAPLLPPPARGPPAA